MTRFGGDSPWQALFRTAAAQDGLFSASQAKELGVSQQLLAKYLASRRIERVKRALYRVVDFPSSEHEDLVSIWLWTRTEGVFSHETALFLHDLSDVLPNRAHVTLPTAWEHRQVKIPEGLVVRYAEIPSADRAWIGPLPVTAVRRTLTDCLHDFVAPELVAQAFAQAADRGLIAPHEVIAAPSVALWRRHVP